jgi:sodium/bile acid cotransporter 3/5
VSIEENPAIIKLYHNGSMVDSSHNFSFEFDVKGLFLGRTKVRFSVNGEFDKDIEYAVSVIRPDRVVDRLFVGLVMTIVMLANIGMGCKVELEVVKEVLKRPIPPLIGFLCQYLIMPLVSMIVLSIVQPKPVKLVKLSAIYNLNMKYLVVYLSQCLHY